MLTTSFYSLESLLFLIFTGLVLFGFHLLDLRYSGHCLTNIEDYLFKLARITQKSEYAIFHEAAKKWPVSKVKVEEDFKRYLLEQITPYYVNDFIRKHKYYLDNWRTPNY